MRVLLSVVIHLQTRKHLIFSVLEGLPLVPLKIFILLSLKSDALHESFTVSYHPATDEETSHI